MKTPLKILILLALIIPLSPAWCAQVEIVVADGIITSDADTDPEGFLPSATVYRVSDAAEKSFARYLLARREASRPVWFAVREVGAGEDDWISLGDGPHLTDAEGTARPERVRKWIPRALLDTAPVDLQLRAAAVLDNGSTIYDTAGLLRVLSEETDRNPEAVFADHDNTLHATGGANSVSDWIDFLNWTRSELPLVDDYVVEAVASLRAEKRDIVIVSLLSPGLYPLARDQVNRHFENAGQRFIPLVVKSHLCYKAGRRFKAEALSLLRLLYGPDNCMAMVGDTVRQDGYGALAGQVPYIPYRVNYGLHPLLLLTGGFGPIDPSTIAWDWSEVMEGIGE